MAKRRSGRAHMAWVRSFKKSNPRRRRKTARRRRNPGPIGAMLVNRRRRVHHKRRARRNPPGEARQMRILGIGLPSIETMAYAGAGFLAPPFLESYIRPYLPAGITSNPVGKYAFKLGSVLGVTYLANRFLGRKAGRSVAMGGGVYILASLAADFAPQLISAGAAAPGLNSYVMAGRVSRSMGSYVQPNRRNMGIPSSAFSGGGSGAIGGTASRFKRI